MKWHQRFFIIKFIPSKINYILVGAWGEFKLYWGAIIREIFIKINISPLVPPILRDNTQACVDAAQYKIGNNSKDIEALDNLSATPLDTDVIRTSEPMVILRETESQKPSRNLVFHAATYDAV